MLDRWLGTLWRLLGPGFKAVFCLTVIGSLFIAGSNSISPQFNDAILYKLSWPGFAQAPEDLLQLYYQVL